MKEVPSSAGAVLLASSCMKDWKSRRLRFRAYGMPAVVLSRFNGTLMVPGVGDGLAAAPLLIAIHAASTNAIVHRALLRMLSNLFLLPPISALLCVILPAKVECDVVRGVRREACKAVDDL